MVLWLSKKSFFLITLLQKLPLNCFSSHGDAASSFFICFFLILTFCISFQTWTSSLCTTLALLLLLTQSYLNSPTIAYKWSMSLFVWFQVIVNGKCEVLYEKMVPLWKCCLDPMQLPTSSVQFPTYSLFFVFWLLLLTFVHFFTTTTRVGQNPTAPEKTFHHTEKVDGWDFTY